MSTQLTEKEQADYLAKRSNYFKGTISVSVIYGTLALVLFLLAVFTAKGRDLLANEMRPFTVTVLAGMILVIILLVVSILRFKAKPGPRSDIDTMKCPDFWKLEKLSDSDLKKKDANLQYLMQYKCVKPAEGLYAPAGANGILSMGNDITPGTARDKLKAMSDKMYAGESNAVPSGSLKCTEVYPYYMAAEDEKHDKDYPSRIRCQYSMLCGAPWSSACTVKPGTNDQN